MSISLHCHVQFQTKTLNAHIVSVLYGHPLLSLQSFLTSQRNKSQHSVCPDRAKELVSLNVGINQTVPSTVLQPGHEF